MDISPLPAFHDNYIWLIQATGGAWVVDPGDPGPVLQAIADQDLRLEGILITHHHPDHTGGLAALVAATGCEVIGPVNPGIKAVTHRVQDGDTVDVLGTAFTVIAVPGHTLDHIAYYSEAAGALFCGDTLFAGGCGRIFEGDPRMMLTSLDKLAALPDATRVFCAHEYTLSNLAFARAAEPHNSELLARETQCRRLRQQGIPTVPSDIATERATNPFLRPDSPDIIASLRATGKLGDDSRVARFAALRGWKDTF
jgi:hydroxyacylglutathione hydrolase